MDEAKEMDNLKKDKLKELMARDLEKNQKLAAANKRAEEMDARLEDMVSWAVNAHALSPLYHAVQN